MSVMRRISKVSTVLVLAVMATGCIVLPFGRGHGGHGHGGHGGHGHGGRHLAPSSQHYSVGSDALAVPSQQRGR
jgi:hypothetical protein